MGPLLLRGVPNLDDTEPTQKVRRQWLRQDELVQVLQGKQSQSPALVGEQFPSDEILLCKTRGLRRISSADLGGGGNPGSVIETILKKWQIV